MFDYLQKYNRLAKDLRDKISSPVVMAAVEILEKKYAVSLASTVMKVMVKDITINDLPSYFAGEFKLDAVRSARLADEFKKNILAVVKDYLGIKDVVSAGPLRHSFSEASRQEALLDRTQDRPPAERPRPVSSVPSHSGAGVSHDDKISARPAPGGAHFFFSSEDEEEIRQLAKKIDGYGEHAKKETDEEKLGEIIAKAKINFGSRLLASRFEQVMKTYVRGIRKKVDIREFLVKPIERGGLSFDDESADKVIAIADGVIKGAIDGVAAKSPKKISVLEDGKNSLKQGRLEDKPPDIKTSVGEVEKPKEKTSALPVSGLEDVGIRDTEYNLASELKGGRIKKELKKLDTEHELPPPPPTILKRRLPTGVEKEMDKKRSPVKSTDTLPFVKISEDKPSYATVPASRQEVSASKKEQVGIKPPASPVILKPKKKSDRIIFPVGRRAADPAGKTKMEDVKAMPRVMGPIDELKYMNLINFRRLSKEPLDATAKIKDKINLLGEEGYGQRTEGVRKWRLSPINKLYLEIGEESIGKNKPISVIIEERNAAGEKYLTVREFEAIMDLNKSLRF